MKEFILLLIAIAIWVGVWRLAAKRWRRKGWGSFISHLSAGTAGFALSTIFLVVVLPEGKTKSADPAGVASDAPAATDKPATSTESTVETASKQTASEPSVQAETLDVSSSANLDLSLDEYQTRFNRILKSLDMPFRAKLRVDPGQKNDVAKASLNDHLVLIGRVDKKTGKLKDIMLTGSGDGTAKSGANIMIVAVATLAAATPNGSTKTVGPEVLELMKDFDEESGNSVSRIFNGVKFSHMRSKLIGTLFSAEPA
jgi:hypothetical protein